MTTIRLTPKQTTVREGWQWTGQPREEWPAWVQAAVVPRYHDELLLSRRFSGLVINLNNWLVRDPASTDIIPYTDDELWKEFEG